MKLNLETIQQINLFENVTGSKVKDSFLDEGILVFIVEENNVQRALGKNSSNIERLKKMLKDYNLEKISSNQKENLFFKRILK